MASTLGPGGIINAYFSGTIDLVANSGTQMVTANILSAANTNPIPPGAYAISFCDSTGVWAGGALVSVTGAPWSVDTTREITYYSLTPLAGNVALPYTGAGAPHQQANTVALVIPGSSFSAGTAGYISITNLTAAAVSVKYSIVKFV